MNKKNILVSDQQEAFIQAQLATGQFQTASDVIAEALRQQEMRLLEAESLRLRLEVSEQSGISPRSLEKIRQETKSQFLANA